MIAVGLLDAGQSSGFIIGLDYPVRLSVTPAGSILRQGIIGFPCWHPDRGRVVERELLPFWPVQDNHVLTVLRGVDLDAPRVGMPPAAELFIRKVAIVVSGECERVGASALIIQFSLELVAGAKMDRVPYTHGRCW